MILIVEVNGIGMAFDIEIGLTKVMHDPLSGQSASVVAWSTSMIGTHGGDPIFILSALALRMDEFLDNYLRVNDKACKRQK